MAGGNETSCGWSAIERADVSEAIGARLFVNLDLASTFDLPLDARFFRGPSFFGCIGIYCEKTRDVGCVFTTSFLWSALILMW